MLGRVYFEERKFKLAAEELRTAVKLKPSPPQSAHIAFYFLIRNHAVFRGAPWP